MQLTVKVDTKALSAALLKMGKSGVSILRKEMGTQMQAVASMAAQRHRYTTRSGTLDRSISHEVSKTGIRGTVFLDTGTAPYALYQHEGTGMYGARRAPFFIAPVRKKALYWGKRIWSKGHYVSGIKPDRFLYKAFKHQKQAIVKGLNKAYETLIKRAGFNG